MAAQDNQSYDSEGAVNQQPCHHQCHHDDHGDHEWIRHNDGHLRCNHNDGPLRSIDHLAKNNHSTKKEWTKYACTLEQKNISPLACQLSKNKVNYCHSDGS